MTIFIDSLPIDAVIRLWDIFLLEGHKVLFTDEDISSRHLQI